MKTMIKTLAVVATLGLLVSPAWADVPLGTASIDRTAGYFGGQGGEFTIGNNAGLSNAAYAAVARDINAYSSDFQSFCLELSEGVGIPSTVYVKINTSGPTGSQAVNGGAISPPENILPDPLDPKTAWLYRQFAIGALAGLGYNYTPGAARQASAVALQNAIWALEGEAVLNGGLATTFYNAAVAANPKTIGNVRVLNLYSYSNYTGVRQDQLYLMVPAPAAVGLGLLGLGLVGWVKRRMA